MPTSTTPKTLEGLTWSSLKNLHKQSEGNPTDSTATKQLFEAEYLMRAKKEGLVALDKKLDEYKTEFCTLTWKNLLQSSIGLHSNQQEVTDASIKIKAAIKDFNACKNDTDRQNVVSSTIREMRAIYDTLVNVKKLTSGKTLTAFIEFFDAYHVPLKEKEYLKKMF